MLRHPIIFVLALCLASAAWAEEGAKKKDTKPEPGTSVEMPFLVAPMTQDGNLLGYTYISSKLICSSSSACILVRQKLAFIQDAYVRAVNASPIALASDPKLVDKDLLSARLTAVAKSIVGDDKVRNTTFLEIKFSPLHPSDSTAMVPPPEQAPGQGAPADEAAKADGTGKTASSQGATSKPASGPAH